jgi:hypothetical protein
MKMSHRMRNAQLLVALTGVLVLLPAQGADDEASALDLQVEAKSDAPVSSAAPGGRLSIEAALGVQHDRYTGEHPGTRRLSLDYRQQWRLAPGWRLGFSDRLDLSGPTDPGVHTAINSLREAVLSWQDEAAEALSVDVGRVQWRNGPGYGFNPTDYFRRGALRTLTTADPIALRENRMGTVMLRGQRLWQGGSVSLAFAPKLADTPSDEGWSLDLGSTNASNRLLLAWSPPSWGAASGQVLLLGEDHRDPQLGASLTAGLSDAAVAFAEWSGGRQADSLSIAANMPGTARWRNRLATGLTYSWPTKLSLTVEFDYNGAAPDQAAWEAVYAQSPTLAINYLTAAAFSQDSASRTAWVAYAVQKSMFHKDVDLTALVRRNAEDGSVFIWMEVRRHWGDVDLALQWQRAHGDAGTEYGLLPVKQWVQLVGSWYF